MSAPSSRSSKRSESPAFPDDTGSSSATVLCAGPLTCSLPPRVPTPIATTLHNGPPLAPQAIVAPPLSLEDRTASNIGCTDQPDFASANEQHGSQTIPGVLHATSESYAFVDDDDRPSRRKGVAPSSIYKGARCRENQSGQQSHAGAASYDNAERVSMLPGQRASVEHPNAPRGAESTSKPASAVAASALSTLTRQPTQIDEASAPTARRLIFTMSKGLFSTQLIPQFVCEAVRPTPPPPAVKQGDPKAKLPLELQADLPVAAQKEEMLCSNDTSRRYHDDRVHAVRACRVQDGESTSSECQDRSSSPAKRSQVNSRRPPPEARPLSVESARALADDKLPSVNAERASLDSSHPLIPAGEPRAQQSGSKAPERSVLATSKKAATAGAGKSSKRPSTVEGPPPPPPNADAIAASTRAAASAKAGMKRRGSILPTPIAQPHPTRKPSWWSAFASPFLLVAAVAVSPTGGHGEPAGASRPRRPSVAVGENQRSPGRTTPRMIGSPDMTEELGEYSAAADAGIGWWTGSTTAAPLAATGRTRPQQSMAVEDYGHGTRLRRSSLYSSTTVDEFSRRRRKMSTFSDFLTSCLVLLVLVTVAGALLFFTFRLAQILYRPVPQPNIGRPITTENATKTAASSATTIAPTV